MAPHYSPDTLLKILGWNCVLFCGIVVVLAVVEFVAVKCGAKPAPVAGENRGFLKSLKIALYATPWITLIALALSFASEKFAKLCGVELPQQYLVQWLKPGVYEMPIRLVIGAFAIFEAPLLEELIFRRFLYRNLIRVNPASLAAPLAFFTPQSFASVASGLVFALAHWHIATFLPLWYLGTAFAGVYRRTGNIIAPMTVHFLFNFVNFVLCLTVMD